MTLDPLQKAITQFGGQSALARAIGVTQGAVWQWANGKRPIPPEQCSAIETATAGQVRCEEFYPNMKWIRDARGRVTDYQVHCEQRVKQKVA